MMRLVNLFLIACGVVALIYFSGNLPAPKEVERAQPRLAAFTHSKVEPCSVSDIEIKSYSARFLDACRGCDTFYMQGVGQLINRCTVATGIQLKMIGYDKNGAPISVRQGWPASISNIPPGNYTFSLDHWLEYDPAKIHLGSGRNEGLAVKVTARS